MRTELARLLVCLQNYKGLCEKNYWTVGGAVQCLFLLLPRVLFSPLFKPQYCDMICLLFYVQLPPPLKFFFGGRWCLYMGLSNVSVNIFQLFMTRWRWWWPFSNSVSQYYWQLAPIWLYMFLFFSLFLPGTFSFHPRLQATFDESARCLWRIL